MWEEEKPSLNKKSISKYLLWGVPLGILLILIVLLIIQITVGPDEESGDKNFEFESIESTEESDKTKDKELAQKAENTDEKSTKVERTKKEQDTIDSSNEKLDNEDVYAQSYIIEKGDNLWSIATKSALNDPYSWKTIVVQNKERINYTIISQDTGKWKVLIDSGQKLKIKTKESKHSKKTFVQKGKKKYALQLMSLSNNQIDLAIYIVKFLIQDGYYAYLYRTKTKIKYAQDKPALFFYRVRTGFYDSATKSKEIGAEIVKRYSKMKIFPEGYWPVLPSYSELSGEIIDFGIQRSRPWVVQLSNRTKRSKAISDLKKVVSISEFVYISQKKTEDGFLFRTRVGFFETKKKSEKQLKKIQSAFNGSFNNAKLLKVKFLSEAALGQNTGASSKKRIPKP